MDLKTRYEAAVKQFNTEHPERIDKAVMTSPAALGRELVTLPTHYSYYAQLHAETANAMMNAKHARDRVKAELIQQYKAQPPPSGVKSMTESVVAALVETDTNMVAHDNGVASYEAAHKMIGAMLAAIRTKKSMLEIFTQLHLGELRVQLHGAGDDPDSTVTTHESMSDIEKRVNTHFADLDDEDDII